MFCIKTAIMFGLVSVLIGTLINRFVKLPKICDKMNESNMMEICFFLLGLALYGFYMMMNIPNKSQNRLSTTSYLIVTPKLTDTSIDMSF